MHSPGDKSDFKSLRNKSLAATASHDKFTKDFFYRLTDEHKKMKDDIAKS